MLNIAKYLNNYHVAKNVEQNLETMSHEPVYKRVAKPGTSVALCGCSERASTNVTKAM